MHQADWLHRTVTMLAKGFAAVGQLIGDVSARSVSLIDQLR